MNIYHVIVSVALVSTANVALAAGELEEGASNLTRAQVQAETLRSRAAGELDFNEATYPLLPATPMTRTRREVKEEVAQARAAGELDFDESTFPVLAVSPSTLTRKAVRADTLAFYRAHPGLRDELIER